MKFTFVSADAKEDWKHRQVIFADEYDIRKCSSFDASMDCKIQIILLR